ncbi:Elongator complex protein [Polyrhizophydium stewartii]|uniref:Elongator complex protein 5 n=1 Tax=Polyrhizophydium stewartii TaxID=2732419 RepID=A0ABR4MZV0_9FUNG
MAATTAQIAACLVRLRSILEPPAGQQQQHRLLLAHHNDMPPLEPPSPWSSPQPSLSAILLQSAATFISLSPPESPPDMRLSAAGKASDAFTPVFEGVASVVFKKHSGKVVRETTGFRITRKSGETRIELVARPTAIPVPAVPEPDVKASQAPDPAANLSFNLSLTDEQRQQRAQVVLPYLQAQQIQTPNEVVVHPSTHDFDDEDPDDDLDI